MEISNETISIIKVDWYYTLYLLILIGIGELDSDLGNKSIKYNIVKRPNMHLELHVILVNIVYLVIYLYLYYKRI